jgi:hypothetical protein
MRKKTTSTNDQFVNALIDATNKFFSDPKHKMPIPEVLGAVYVFKHRLEQHIAENYPKNKGENDE